MSCFSGQQTDGNPSPEWVTVEELLRKHDESFVKKYESDMDTLLVFVSS